MATALAGRVDKVLVSAVISGGDKAYAEIKRHGIGPEFFDDDFHDQWTYIEKTKRNQGRVPDRGLFKTKFPNARLVKVPGEQMPGYMDMMKKRHRYRSFVHLVERTVKDATDVDEIDKVITNLQTGLGKLYVFDRNHIVDVFGAEFARRIYEDQKERAQDDRRSGFLTGLQRLDEATGGIHRKELVTVIGRTGKGKTWLSLFMLKSAVQLGHRVVLYPLEMGIEDTMYRLYTMFASDLVGSSVRLKNSDLVFGNASRKSFKEFLKIVNREYKGQLLVADISKTRFSYTPERVAADIELYRPDYVAIDYVTLMKRQGGGSSTDWQIIQEMTSSLKQMAMQYDVAVQINAQVNRSAIKGDTKIFLPRPEHISFGDAISQDSGVIISMNREGDTLYYALVKNRHGREFGKTAVMFRVDEGQLIEAPDPEDEVLT